MEVRSPVQCKLTGGTLNHGVHGLFLRGEVGGEQRLGIGDFFGRLCT